MFDNMPSALRASHAAIDAYEDAEGNPFVRTIIHIGWPGVQFRENMSFVGVAEPPGSGELPRARRF